jgi:hypothetical protein
MLSCIRLERQGFQVALTKKRHVEWLYTPPDENGTIELTLLSVAGQHATRMGRESACRYGPPGPIFLQAAEGQGQLRALTGPAAFFFRRR